MKSADALYRRLQRHLDRLPIAFPATGSGVELRLLKHLFSPEEAEIALAMSPMQEPVEKIRRRLKGMHLTTEELRAALDRMAAKGSIMGGTTYGTAPLAIGMFEMQVDRLTKDFVKDFRAYQEEAFGNQFLTKTTSQIRTVPINVTVSDPCTIGRYDDIKGYIGETPGPFGVMNCVCRQSQNLLGHTCTQSATNETCLTIGRAALYMQGRGNARLVSREDMLVILDRAERDGLVLQPQNTQTPGFICCCCGDCCEILTSAQNLARPVEFFTTNYQARLDADRCTGCAACVKRCPMKAVTISGKRARMETHRCIGCGLCASSCRAGAMTLRRRDKQVVPPPGQMALYKRITLDRFGPLRTLGKGARILLGMKL